MPQILFQIQLFVGCVFKWVFYYWYNITDTPYTLSKVNLWFLVNLRVHKTKLLNAIVFYLNTLGSLRFKTLKIFYKDLNYEFFYFKFFQFFFLTIALIVVLI